ncbi:unnamed protein product [Haemonchus placei]|uniref:Transposase n=1 Tax=Haemonchus placei TaxID=6290 RepID=A0A0N4W999_HAEPC|nr:unnamed protein product [Haemonchus placei]
MSIEIKLLLVETDYLLTLPKPASGQTRNGLIHHYL